MHFSLCPINSFFCWILQFFYRTQMSLYLYFVLYAYVKRKKWHNVCILFYFEYQTFEELRLQGSQQSTSIDKRNMLMCMLTIFRLLNLGTWKLIAMIYLCRLFKEKYHFFSYKGALFQIYFIFYTYVHIVTAGLVLLDWRNDKLFGPNIMIKVWFS